MNNQDFESLVRKATDAQDAKGEPRRLLDIGDVCMCSMCRMVRRRDEAMNRTTWDWRYGWRLIVIVIAVVAGWLLLRSS